MRLGKLMLSRVTRFEDLEIDFSALGLGVFALAGPNGAGKTTVMSACCPMAFYREAPERGSSALSSAVHPGGRIGLTFDLASEPYEVEIRLDGKSNTTATAKKCGVSLVTGKVRDYDEWVERTLGPKEAVYVSIYGMQGGVGRFSQLAISQRKEIFRYYLGLDRLQLLHEKSRDRSKLLDASGSDAAHLRAERLCLESQDLPAAQARERLAVKAVDEAFADRDVARDAWAVASRLLLDLQQWDEYDRLCMRGKALRQTLDATAAAAKASPGPCPSVADLHVEHDVALAAEREYQEAVREGQEVVRAEDAARSATELLVQKACAAEKSAERLQGLPCHGTGIFASCQFIRDAVASRDALPQMRIKIKEQEAKREEIVARKAPLPPKIDAKPIAAALRQATSERERWLREDAAIQAAAAKLEAIQGEYDTLKVRAIALKRELPERPASRNSDVEAVRVALEGKERAYDLAVSAHADATARIRSSQERVKLLEANLAELEARLRDKPALDLLAQALGPDGVQAYEFDASGPTVSGIANQLLESCYGSRFTIEISTQKDKKTGGMKEDFSVRVHDGLRARDGDLASYSGGEQVVIDEALRLALSIFASQKLPVKWETLFRDENAGALDVDNAHRYVNMLHKARELGGFHQILFVAHDQSVVEAATGVLRFCDGGVKIA
ncbi:MAG: hypothetical protein UY96_C0010G0023 [Parcubacteria group bacterium GW2011_GWB1_56_8]|nr:MAG: hypothetical protein UY96_C0010G0023 [Parcubacteria group bacterium GW2011_GWB1_56_8]